MSTPKKDDSMMDLFEARFYEFGRRISEVGSVKIDLESLKKLVSSLSDKLDASLVKDKTEEIERSVSLISDRLNASESKVSSLKSNIDEVGRFHSSRLSSLEDFKSNHYALEAKHYEAEKNTDRLLQFSQGLHASLKDQESRFPDIHKILASHRESLEGQKSDISQVKGSANAVRSELASHVTKTYELAASVMQRLDDLDGKISFLKSDYESKFLEMKTLIDKKVSSIVLPDVSSFATMQSVEDHSHKVHLASLDAKNACAKSANVEVAIAVMQRKLDQILIQMKTYELQSAKE